MMRQELYLIIMVGLATILSSEAEFTFIDMLPRFMVKTGQPGEDQESEQTVSLQQNGCPEANPDTPLLCGTLLASLHSLMIPDSPYKSIFTNGSAAEVIHAHSHPNQTQTGGGNHTNSTTPTNPNIPFQKLPGFSREEEFIRKKICESKFGIPGLEEQCCHLFQIICKHGNTQGEGPSAESNLVTGAKVVNLFIANVDDIKNALKQIFS